METEIRPKAPIPNYAKGVTRLNAADWENRDAVAPLMQDL